MNRRGFRSGLTRSTAAVSFYLFCCFFACNGLAAARSAPSAPRTIGASERYIVRLNAASHETIAATAAALVGAHGGTLHAVWSRVVHGFEASLTSTQAAAMAADHRVAALSLDSAAQVAQAVPPACSWTGSTFVQTSVMPTSPQPISCPQINGNCADDWALDRIDQRQLPMNGSFSYGKTGRGVHIYMIDSGISSHQEFLDSYGQSRIGNGINFASHNPGDKFSVNSYINPNDVYDWEGHGTHQSSVAAGLRYGVAKEATIHPVRVVNSNSTRTALVISALDWIATHAQRPAIVNVSLGFHVGCAEFQWYQDTSSAMDSMELAFFNLIHQQGIAVVNAAGNFNSDVVLYSPARMEDVLVVGGTWENDYRWAYASPGQNCSPFSNTPPGFPRACDTPAYAQCGSNFGSTVDLFAPAFSILAAWPDGSQRAGCVEDGTSMSAPLVTGAAALYLESYPTASPQQVRDALVSRATNGAVLGALGYGTPNRLLYLDRPPVPQVNVSCSHLQCTFDGSASSDDFGITSWSWTFGDGTSAQGVASVSHAYAFTGSYQVTLTVRDSWGNQANAVRTATATP